MHTHLQKNMHKNAIGKIIETERQNLFISIAHFFRKKRASSENTGLEDVLGISGLYSHSILVVFVFINLFCTL